MAGMTATLASPALSPAESFAQDGFYIARGLFRDRVAVLEREFDRICDQLERSGEEINARWRGGAADAVNGPGRVVQHTHNVQLYSAVWAQLWYDQAYLDVAEQFLGPDIILHHTKLFRKPAEKGAAFPMHQDWPYFPTIKDTNLAAIVHVSDATDEMGCLRVHPGSHKAGRLADSGGMSDVGEVQRRYPLETAMPVECKAGDVVFFHSLTVHGSRINSSDRVRKTVLCQMYAGHDRVDPRHAAHSDARLVLRGWNQHMTRELANG
jgi:ectoine hydroxylase-related dioxygenase (phytanoyl-CoA dioxygenase family)